MTVVRWDPFRALRSVEHEFNRLWEDARAGSASTAEAPAPTWSPNVEVYDRDDNVELAIELPGVDSTKVEIHLDGDVLSVRGERQPADVKPEKVYFREGLYGPFYRAFTLPPTVKRDAIKADYKDGILRLTLPRAEEAKPRLIPLQPAA